MCVELEYLLNSAALDCANINEATGILRSGGIDLQLFLSHYINRRNSSISKIAASQEDSLWCIYEAEKPYRSLYSSSEFKLEFSPNRMAASNADMDLYKLVCGENRLRISLTQNLNDGTIADSSHHSQIGSELKRQNTLYSESPSVINETRSFSNKNSLKHTTILSNTRLLEKVLLAHCAVPDQSMMGSIFANTFLNNTKDVDLINSDDKGIFHTHCVFPLLSYNNSSYKAIDIRVGKEYIYSAHCFTIQNAIDNDKKMPVLMIFFSKLVKPIAPILASPVLVKNSDLSSLSRDGSNATKNPLLNENNPTPYNTPSSVVSDIDSHVLFANQKNGILHEHEFTEAEDANEDYNIVEPRRSTFASAISTFKLASQSNRSSTGFGDHAYMTSLTSRSADLPQDEQAKKFYSFNSTSSNEQGQMDV
jgi:hypothetical protein